MNQHVIKTWNPNSHPPETWAVTECGKTITKQQWDEADQAPINICKGCIKAIKQEALNDKG